MCLWVWSTCGYANAIPNEALDPLNMELPAVVSHLMLGAENRNQVL